MGLENVFLSVRPIVESLARSTILSSTTLFSNNRKVQRARPLGGLEQAKAISLAFGPLIDRAKLILSVNRRTRRRPTHLQRRGRYRGICREPYHDVSRICL